MKKTKLFKKLYEILNSGLLKNNPVQFLKFEEEIDSIHFFPVDDDSNYFDVIQTGNDSFRVITTQPDYKKDYLTPDDVQDKFRQWLLQFK